MEIISKCQAAINKLASLKLDILELVASPVTVYNTQGGMNLQNMKIRPGAMIGVNGPVDDTQFRPLVFNMQGLQALYPEIGSLMGFMQQGLGINDDVAGMPSSDRQSAREAMIRHEEMLKRLATEAKLAEKVIIEPVMETFRDLDKQYLTLPHQRNILGSRAEINEITGLPLPQQPTILTLDDLRQDYNARAVGSSMFISRNQRKMDGMALLQAMQSNPVAVQAVNWTNFFRQLFEMFDFGSPDELLVKNVPAINQLAGANGGELPGGGGPMNQAQGMPQLDPQAIEEQPNSMLSPFGG
jgi:hypothetical protein